MPDEIALAPWMERPHVVILGAGASRAALPSGDRHGRPLPLMADLVDALELRPLLRQHGLDETAPDFEVLYSSLSDDAQHPELVAELERRTWEYFAALELPDQPTLYDRLVLSLRDKDFIATFNWDPLLWQALTRAARLLGPDVLPRPLFLHGSVAVAHCLEHQPPTQGDVGQQCQRCGRLLASCRLLFPVTKKDYANDPAIARYWEIVRRALAGAYFLTVFGYRAPTSDAEAMELMSKAWGQPKERRFEEVEIVDIRPQDELVRDWNRFIHTTHYGTTSDFQRSYLAKHPRRSCEDFFEASMQLRPQHERPLPRDAGWAELVGDVQPLVDRERQRRCDKPPQTELPQAPHQDREDGE